MGGQVQSAYVRGGVQPDDSKDGHSVGISAKAFDNRETTDHSRVLPDLHQDQPSPFLPVTRRYLLVPRQMARWWCQQIELPSTLLSRL